MNRIRVLVLTIAICTALQAAIPAVAGAAQGAITAPTVIYHGVVVDATAGQLTFHDLRGDFLAARLTPTTRYAFDGQPSPRPRFEAGETIDLTAYREPDGSLVARFVGVYDVTRALFRFHGRVVDSSPHSLTIHDRAGNYVAFQLIPGTRYRVDGRPVPRPDLRPGQRVFVLAHREADGSLTARVVAITHLDLKRLAGTVIASSLGSLTFRDRNGDVYAMALIQATRYIVDGQPSPRPVFRFGEAIAIVAHQEDDGSLTARRVTLVG